MSGEEDFHMACEFVHKYPLQSSTENTHQITLSLIHQDVTSCRKITHETAVCHNLDNSSN